MSGVKKFVVRDPIHNDIILDECHKVAISTPEFQRLRYIAQNGLLYLVYPGMRHSRFEHSLGAAHLAYQLLPKIEDNYLKHLSGVVPYGGPMLLINETQHCIGEIQKNLQQWREIFTMAALLHDVGHGPLSHTFEHLKMLDKSKFKYSGNNTFLMSYFEQQVSRQTHKFEHEDISILYIDEILKAVSWEPTRVHKTCFFISKPFRQYVLGNMENSGLSELELLTCTLLAPYISGFFDVDRLDYLKRDSQMAGVPYGHVEFDRILRSVRTVLCREKEGSATKVGILVKAKNYHMLDHFLIGLYEMYTQVYYHPVSQEFQHQLALLLGEIKDKFPTVDYQWHKNSSDYSFLMEVRERLEGDKILDDILMRKFGRQKPRVMQLTSSSSQVYSTLINNEGWEKIEVHERKMLKSEMPVWLVDRSATVGENSDAKPEILTWSVDSLVASKLNSVAYNPVVVWKNEEFARALDSLKEKLLQDTDKKPINGGRAKT